MPNIIFYFDHELSHKISNLKNRSQIAQELFSKYFEKQVKPDLKEIAKELTEVEERKRLLEDTKTRVVVAEKVREITEQEIKEKEELRIQYKKDSAKKSACNFFSEFELLEEEEQDRLINLYLNNNPDDLNLVQFLVSKGFKDNIVVEED